MAEATNPITTASNPRVGPLERVRHLKRGTEYEVLGEAEAQVATGTVRTTMLGKPLGGIYRRIADGLSLTVYRDPATGKLWCRPTDEFRDGRFETIASAPSPEAGAGGDLGKLERLSANLSHLRGAAVAVLNAWNRPHDLDVAGDALEAAVRATPVGKLIASTGSGKEETKGASFGPGSCPSGPTASRSSGFAAAIPSRGWSTIDDCPSDGRMIWVFGGRHKKPALRAADGSRWRHEAKTPDFAHTVPTHWMPEFTPEPPVALAGEAEGRDRQGSVHEHAAPQGATPEATPQSSPSQTPVDPQMTVEEAREAFARQRAEADRDFDEDLMPGGFN